MPDVNDMDLVREYATANSEPAFETLVRRHVSLVYSVAFRQTGNPAQAEEITQAVFLILARKAAILRPDTVLAGWFHETARLASASFLRGEARRRRREQEAYMQSKLHGSAADFAWEQLEPLLDEAIGQLGKADRNAVVLRFFQNKSAREIAAALQVGESAAQKRLNRAVEKLRAYFLKRGVAVSASALIGALAVNSVPGAPAHLVASVMAISANGAAVSSSTLTLIQGALKIMAWTKAKTAVVAGACVLLAAGTVTTLTLGNRSRPIQGIPKDWSVLNGQTDQWNWTNGVITGHTTNGDSILASAKQYGNVTVSALVSTTNREASLALRLQDGENGYLAVFAPDGTPSALADTSKIVLVKRQAGEERELAIFKRRGLSAPGQLEKFTFQANGTHLEIRLNDNPIIKTNDASFASGFIGLRVYGDPKYPSDGVFSNLTVY